MAWATWEWRPETTIPAGPRPATTTTCGEPGHDTLRRPGARVTRVSAASRAGSVPARAVVARRTAAAPRLRETAAGSQVSTWARTGSSAPVPGPAASGPVEALSPSDSAASGPVGTPAPSDPVRALAPSGPTASGPMGALSPSGPLPGAPVPAVPVEPAGPVEPAVPAPAVPAPGGAVPAPPATAWRAHRQAATTWTHTPATGQGQRACAGPSAVSTTSTPGRPTTTVTASWSVSRASTRPAATSARARRTSPRLARAARATSSKAA